MRSPLTVKLHSPTADSANFAAATLSAALTSASPRTPSSSSSFASTASTVSLSPLRDRATGTATHHHAHHHQQQAHLAAVDALLLQHVAAESAIALQLAASNKFRALPPPFAMPAQPLYRSNGPPQSAPALTPSPSMPDSANDALLDLVESAANVPTVATNAPPRYFSASRSAHVESPHVLTSLGPAPQSQAARHPLDAVAAAASIGRSTLIPELPMSAAHGVRGMHSIVRPVPQLAIASPISALRRPV